MSLFEFDAGEEWGGSQKQTFLLTQEMYRRGLTVRLFVQPRTPLHQKASEQGLPVFPLPMKSVKNILARMELTRQMKKHKCRLVHFHDAHSLAVGSDPARWAKVPLRFISEKGALSTKGSARSRKKFNKDIDGVIAVSQEVKSALAAEGFSQDRISVVPEGVDYSQFEHVDSSLYLHTELSFLSDDFLMGVVGPFADREDEVYFIDAVRILKEKAPKIKVIVIGDGPLEIAPSQLIKGTSIEDVVFFLGFREDIPQILASLDLFVLLSHEPSPRCLAMEAMASRLPVVAFRGGSLSEIVVHGETGLLLPPRHSDSLAEAAVRIFRDREWGKRLGQTGYELIHQKYSAKAMTSRIICEYERIAQNKKVKLFP